MSSQSDYVLRNKLTRKYLTASEGWTDKIPEETWSLHAARRWKREYVHRHPHMNIQVVKLHYTVRAEVIDD